MSAHQFYSTIHEFPLFIIPSIYCMKAKTRGKMVQILQIMTHGMSSLIIETSQYLQFRSLNILESDCLFFKWIKLSILIGKTDFWGLKIRVR